MEILNELEKKRAREQIVEIVDYIFEKVDEVNDESN